MSERRKGRDDTYKRYCIHDAANMCARQKFMTRDIQVSEPTDLLQTMSGVVDRAV